MQRTGHTKAEWRCPHVGAYPHGHHILIPSTAIGAVILRTKSVPSCIPKGPPAQLLSWAFLHRSYAQPSDGDGFIQAANCHLWWLHSNSEAGRCKHARRVHGRLMTRNGFTVAHSHSAYLSPAADPTGQFRRRPGCNQPLVYRR
jgi:hypothetical protein